MNVDEVAAMIAAERELSVLAPDRPPATKCYMHPADFNELRAATLGDIAAPRNLTGCILSVSRFMGFEVIESAAVPRGSVLFDGPPPPR